MSDWIVEPLNPLHEQVDFSCGHASLDDFLKKYAGQYARRRLGTTYVAVVRGQPRVLGYYTLAPSHFEFAHSPAELLKGLPKHPVPSLLLARLAVTQTEHGKGLGAYLLFDAFDRCLRVAREVAFRAIEVEAIDDRAAGFYAKHGFRPFPADPHHLAIAIETVEEALAREATWRGTSACPPEGSADRKLTPHSPSSSLDIMASGEHQLPDTTTRKENGGVPEYENAAIWCR
jgi:GNAT superfamily N-acetyltransferase